MSIFNDIVNTIKSNLSQSSSLSNVKFINSTVMNKVPNPIEKVYVSIGINNIEIKNGAMNSYLGIGKSGEKYGNNADIDIEMKIFSPKEKGLENCYTIFSSMYEDILCKNQIYNVKSVSCGQVSYNSDIFSFELICNIKLNLFIAYETNDINISNIVIEKKR